MGRFSLHGPFFSQGISGGAVGKQSRLFFEVPRVLKVLRKVGGGEIVVKYVVENVASMGKPECEEIGYHLGVQPCLIS